MPTEPVNAVDFLGNSSSGTDSDVTTVPNTPSPSVTGATASRSNQNPQPVKEATNAIDFLKKDIPETNTNTSGQEEYVGGRNLESTAEQLGLENKGILHGADWAINSLSPSQVEQENPEQISYLNQDFGTKLWNGLVGHALTGAGDWLAKNLGFAAAGAKALYDSFAAGGEPIRDIGSNELVQWASDQLSNKDFEYPVYADQNTNKENAYQKAIDNPGYFLLHDLPDRAALVGGMIATLYMGEGAVSGTEGLAGLSEGALISNPVKFLANTLNKTTGIEATPEALSAITKNLSRAGQVSVGAYTVAATSSSELQKDLDNQLQSTEINPSTGKAFNINPDTNKPYTKEERDSKTYSAISKDFWGNFALAIPSTIVEFNNIFKGFGTEENQLLAASKLLADGETAYKPTSFLTKLGNNSIRAFYSGLISGEHEHYQVSFENTLKQNVLDNKQQNIGEDLLQAGKAFLHDWTDPDVASNVLIGTVQGMVEGGVGHLIKDVVGETKSREKGINDYITLLQHHKQELNTILSQDVFLKNEDNTTQTDSKGNFVVDPNSLYKGVYQLFKGTRSSDQIANVLGTNDSTTDSFIQSSGLASKGLAFFGNPNGKKVLLSLMDTLSKEAKDNGTIFKDNNGNIISPEQHAGFIKSQIEEFSKIYNNSDKTTPSLGDVATQYMKNNPTADKKTVLEKSTELLQQLKTAKYQEGVKQFLLNKLKTANEEQVNYLNSTNKEGLYADTINTINDQNKDFDNLLEESKYRLKNLHTNDNIKEILSDRLDGTYDKAIQVHTDALKSWLAGDTKGYNDQVESINNNFKERYHISPENKSLWEDYEGIGIPDLSDSKNNETTDGQTIVDTPPEELVKRDPIKSEVNPETNEKLPQSVTYNGKEYTVGTPYKGNDGIQMVPIKNGNITVKLSIDKFNELKPTEEDEQQTKDKLDEFVNNSINLINKSKTSKELASSINKINQDPNKDKIDDISYEKLKNTIKDKQDSLKQEEQKPPVPPEDSVTLSSNWNEEYGVGLSSINRIYNTKREVLQKFIISGSKEEILKSLSLVVTQSTLGTAIKVSPLNSKNKAFTKTPHIDINGFQVPILVGLHSSITGSIIGYLPFHKLYTDSTGKTELSPDTFSEILGYINTYKGLANIYDIIQKELQDKKQINISNEDLTKSPFFIEMLVSPGSLDLINDEVNKKRKVPAPSLSEIEFAKLPELNGGFMILDNQSGFPINPSDERTQLLTDYPFNNTLSNRYVTLTKTPSGDIAWIGLSLNSIGEGEIKSIVSDIQSKVKELKEKAGEKSIATLKKEDPTLWNSLQQAADQFNDSINSRLYIANTPSDEGILNKGNLYLGISPLGNIRFTFDTPKDSNIGSKNINVSGDTIEELIANYNEQVEGLNEKFPGLNLFQIDKRRLKQSIPNNGTTDEVLGQLKANVTKNIYRNGGIDLSFNTNNVESQITKDSPKPEIKIVNTLSESNVAPQIESKLDYDTLISKALQNGNFDEADRLTQLKIEQDNKTKPNETAYKISTIPADQLIDLNNAKQWIETHLPSTISIDNISSLFDNINDGTTTWGAFKDNIIYLSKYAEEGTAQHEAFHAVFRNFLSNTELARMYEVGRIRYGKGRSKIELEEKMADDFAKYSIENRQPKNLIEKFFDKIKQFVKWITGNSDKLDSLFYSIERGDFKNSNIKFNDFFGKKDLVLKQIPYGPDKQGAMQYATARESRIITTTIAAKVQEAITNNDFPELGRNRDAIIDKIISNQYSNNLFSTPLNKNIIQSKDQPEDKQKVISYLQKQQGLFGLEASKILIKERVNRLFQLYETTDENNDEITQEKINQIGDRDYDQEAWSIGGFGSLSKEIRQYIGFTLFSTDDEIGRPVQQAVDSSAVYNGISRLLTNTPVENMIQKLEEFSQWNPETNAIYQKLTLDVGLKDYKPTKNFNNFVKFTNSFKTFAVEYQTALQDRDKDTLRSIDSNQHNVKQRQFDRWANEYDGLFHRQSDEQIASTKKSIIVGLAEVAGKLSKSSKQSNIELNATAVRIKELLSNMKIDVSDAYLNFSLISAKINSPENIDKNPDSYLTKQQLNIYNTFADTKPLDLEDIKQISTTINKGFNPFSKGEGSDTSNKTRLLNIAEGNSVFDEQVGSSNFQNADNQQVFSLLQGSYMLEEIAKLNEKKERNALLKKDSFLKKNYLLTHNNVDSIFNRLKVGLIDGIRQLTNRDIDRQGSTFGSFDERSYALTNYALFQNKKKDKASGLETAIYNIAQNEASNTAYTLRLPVEDFYHNDNLSDKAISIISDSVENEYNRIRKVNKEIESGNAKVLGYNVPKKGITRGTDFFIFKWLKDEQPDLYNNLIKDSSTENNLKLSEDNRKLIEKAVEKHFNKAIDSHLKDLARLGILKLEGTKISNILFPKKDIEDQGLKNYVGSFFMNDYINSQAINEVLDGDPAIGRVDFTDYVKRNKGRMASGLNMGDGTHTVAYTQGHKFTSRISGKSIDSDDAQSHITPEHRQLELERWGKLPNKAKNLYYKILSGTYFPTYEEAKYLEEIGAAFNSVKTVTFGRQTLGTTKGANIQTTIYHKLSEFTLMRQITSYPIIDNPDPANPNHWEPIRGREFMHNKLNSMYRDNIDQTVPTTGSKLTTLIPAESIDGNYDLKSSGITVDNTYKRLQVETPSGKTEGTLGSQLQQLIDYESNLSKIQSSIEREKVSQALKDYKDSISQFRKNNMDRLKSMLVDKDGNVKLTEAARKFLDTVENSNADDQLLEFFSLNDNGENKYNYNLMPIVDKFNQLYLAHFSTGAFKLKVPMQKVSLVSDEGINVIRNKDGRVITTKEQLINPQNYINHEVSRLQFNVKDPDGNVYTECILSEYHRALYNLKAGDIIPPEVSKMFGIRIPTEDKYSMMNLKAVDFLPAIYGSVGIFPPELIEISGADFDIDSLYIQVPKFYSNNNRKIIKYGDFSKGDNAFDQYKKFQLDKNKELKNLIHDKLEGNSEYENLKTNFNKDLYSKSKEELNTIINEINKLEDLPEEGLSEVELMQYILDFDTKKLNNLKKDAKELYDILAPFEKALSRLREVKDNIITQSIKELGLPSNLDELESRNKNQGEQNDYILTNKILDSQNTILSNPEVQKIQKESANIKGLDDIIDKADSLKKQPPESYADLHSITGKMRANTINSEGKDNIAISALANITSAWLTTHSVSLREDAYTPEIDGHKLNSYSSTLDFRGNRKGQSLSTILAAMADNAKDPKASKLNWSPNILSTANDLLAKGMPLDLVGFLTKQRVIKYYNDLSKVKRYSVKTEEEDNDRDNIYSKIFSTLGTGVEDLDISKFTTKEIEDELKNPTNEGQGRILAAWQKWEEQAQTFSKVNKLLSLNKGLSSSFEDLETVNQAIKDFKLGTDKTLAKDIPFDIRDAVKEDKSLTQILKQYQDVISTAEKFLIAETKFSKRSLNIIKDNISPAKAKRGDIIKSIKMDLLGYMAIRSFKNYLSQNPSDINNLRLESSTDPNLLFPQFSDQTLGDRLKELKDSNDPLISSNPLIKYLIANNAGTVDNKSLIDTIEGEIRIKENPQYASELLDAYSELFNKPDTQKFAVDLFSYLLMKDNLRFKNKSFIKYISPFMFNSMSQSLKNINELLSKDLSTKENSEEFKKSLGMDPKQLFNEFFEEYASYAPNRKNLKYVGNIDKKSSSFTKVQDGIKFNLFGNIEKHNFKQKLTEDELKTFSKNKQDLGKIFNRAVDENSGFTVFEFPRFVTYRGKVYKLTELQNRALKNLKTSPNFEDSETIYKGTSANYSLVDSVDKGILPYAFDLTENKQISDLLGIETKDSEPIPDSDPNPEPPDTGDAPFDYSDNIVYSNDQFNEAIKKEENSNKPVKKITEKSTTKVDEIWNKNSDNIQVKYPDITKEIWNLMTEEEKQRLIDCL